MSAVSLEKGQMRQEAPDLHHLLCWWPNLRVHQRSFGQVDVSFESLTLSMKSNSNYRLETATSTLLEKFEELRQELHSVKQAVYDKSADSIAQGLTPEVVRNDPFDKVKVRQTVQTASAAESSRDFLQIPPHRASADTVLRWEVFGNKYPENALIGTLFKDSTGSFQNNLVTTNTSLTPLEDEQIPMLIDRFLQNVHTKNPILDVEALVKHGRQCAERGIGWDARSCLVLMACALGSVAKPFTRPMPPDSHVYDRRHVSTSTPSTARLYAKELEQGDSCFTLACRRLGSLKYSMLSAQCYFFAGGMFLV